MARLYADENFDHQVVRELTNLGHDVLTAQQAGQAQRRIPDADVLSFAISVGRAVLTFNRRHFIRLHQTVRPHRGIIVCTRDDDAAALAVRIHQAISPVASLDDTLLRINLPPRP